MLIVQLNAKGKHNQYRGETRNKENNSWDNNFFCRYFTSTSSNSSHFFWLFLFISYKFYNSMLVECSSSTPKQHTVGVFVFMVYFVKHDVNDHYVTECCNKTRQIENISQHSWNANEGEIYKFDENFIEYGEERRKKRVLLSKLNMHASMKMCASCFYSVLFSAAVVVVIVVNR